MTKLSSDQRELYKHELRRLKTEIYEYESELKLLNVAPCSDPERRDIVLKLVLNLRQRLVEIEEPMIPHLTIEDI